MSKIKVSALAPHMVLAAYNWISEAGGIPYMTFAADFIEDPVLLQYARPIDAKDPGSPFVLVLNMSMQACPTLRFTDGVITGHMSFGGKKTNVCIPMNLVLTVYDRDSGTGIPVNTLEGIIEWTQEQNAEAIAAADIGLGTVANDGPADNTATQEAKPAKRPNHLKLVH
jgi:stringent starvation protein B